MEGKEVRFGIVASALFAVITTAASCGAVNAMHDSFTALGGMVPLINMQLGEIIVGGVGAGLYGMLLFVILAVFVAGLMVGRTPEYVGKKIEAQGSQDGDARHSDPAADDPWLDGGRCGQSAGGCRQLNNAGPHGFSEMLYLYTSSTGNNGIGLRRHHGQHAVLQHHRRRRDVRWPLHHDHPGDGDCRIAAAKKAVPPSAGTFPTTGGLFVGLVVGVILIVGGLTFFPALALGPIVEQFAMTAGTVF